MADENVLHNLDRPIQHLDDRAFHRRLRHWRIARHRMIDPHYRYYRVHGYQGLHIVDGSAVSASLDVNPALTIIPRPGRAAQLAVPLPRCACPRR